jgi:hypothetical protein
LWPIATLPQEFISAMPPKADKPEPTRMTPMYGPAVRCKRFCRSGGCGLASMYPVSDWSLSWLPTIMDISAHAALLADRPQRAIRVTSVRTRREDRSSISSHSLADLGGTLLAALSTVRHSSLSFVRALRRFLRPGLRTQTRRAQGAVKGWPSRWSCLSLPCCQATP